MTQRILPFPQLVCGQLLFSSKLKIPVNTPQLTHRHICEHVLGQLSRVVARDSSIAVAGVQDLYVALCEDESIWGLFKRLQGKSNPSDITDK